MQSQKETEILYNIGRTAQYYINSQNVTPQNIVNFAKQVWMSSF